MTSRKNFLSILCAHFRDNPEVNGNYISLETSSGYANQQQTNDAFTEKWTSYGNSLEKDTFYAAQKKWYLQLYGFASEEKLAAYLSRHAFILDAGCGLGYKAAWFAELSPKSVVLGIDFSDAVLQAAQAYAHLPNLFFTRGDISNTGLKDNSADYVSCDQVIMHTEDPERTFTELTRVTAAEGEFACYFYAKKALPRELLDDYFRIHCKNLSNKEIWELSEQLTELGKRLSELKISFESPDIPVLGIKGGTYDIQRFIYWNFLKCYWNSEAGHETSVVTNFDWYSPSNARRFTEEEVRRIVSDNGLDTIFFHQEEACYSGRFGKPSVAAKP